MFLVLTCTVTTAIPFFYSDIYANFYVWMQFIQAFTEIAIVLYLRYQINQFQKNLAFMRLITWHVCNFIIWVVVVFPQTRMDPSQWFKWWQHPSGPMEVDLLATDIIAPYLQVFTLLLVRQFAKNMAQKDIRDKHLKKDVPFAVFI